MSKSCVRATHAESQESLGLTLSSQWMGGGVRGAVRKEEVCKGVSWLGNCNQTDRPDPYKGLIVQSTQAAPEPQFRHGMGNIAHGFEILAAGQQLLVLLRFFLVCQVAAVLCPRVAS